MLDIYEEYAKLTKPTEKMKLFMGVFKTLSEKDQSNINRLCVRVAMNMYPEYRFKNMGVMSVFELVATLSMYKSNPAKFKKTIKAWRSYVEKKDA